MQWLKMPAPYMWDMMIFLEMYADCPPGGKSIDVLTARQTEIVNCNWEGIASRAPPKVGQICV